MLHIYSTVKHWYKMLTAKLPARLNMDIKVAEI